MSDLGLKQTLTRDQPMSALPPKADIGERKWDVRFVPEVEVVRSDQLNITSAGRSHL
jgi:hypothetical protein